MSKHFLPLVFGGLTMAMVSACAGGGDATMGSYLSLEYDDAIEQAVHKTCGTNSTFRGIDVSKWQGDVDWAKVAADPQDIKFAIARVSDGLNYSDSKFETNYKKIKEAGLIRGTYQFFRPSQDALQQADYLIEKIGGKLEANDLPPVIDVENAEDLTAEEVTRAVTTWVNRVESKLGVKPIIYTGGYFWDSHVKSSDFADYPLWHAAYPNTWTSSSCPSISEKWTNWAIWQYSSTASVNGISGNVDINVFNGTLEDLQKLTYGGSCAKVPATGRIIDETDSCFFGGGKSKYLRKVTDGGYNGSLIWSKTWVTSAPSNYGKWNFNFERGGKYRMDYYLSNKSASLTDVATEMPYQIMHDGNMEVVVIDQSGHEGWKEVGTFYFAAGGNQYLIIDDAVSEIVKAGKQFLLDAVRLVPVELDEIELDPREVCSESPAAGRIIDETEACFVGGGDPKWLRSLDGAGYQSHLIWSNTKSTVGSEATSTGTYNLNFKEAGSYEVLVYIPFDKSAVSAASGKNICSGVQYEVKHAGSVSQLTVNQSSASGWYSLGAFDFAAGGDQYLMVKDSIAAADYKSQTFIMDAIQCSRIYAQGEVPSDPDDDTPVIDIPEDEGEEEEPMKPSDFNYVDDNNNSDADDKPLINDGSDDGDKSPTHNESDEQEGGVIVVSDNGQPKRGCNGMAGDVSTLSALLLAASLLLVRRKQLLK